MSIDLERFPESDSAKRMLTYVTKNWYEKSYVGKWIYEVMGREIDLAAGHIEELPYQMFIDTATWGLKFHEIKYGLPIREDLSYEERRRLLREKRNTKAPMTPWRMEQVLKGVTGYEVVVHDINDPGYRFSDPYIFSVQLEGEGEIDIGEIRRRIDKLKQSHTIYILSLILMSIGRTEEFHQKVSYYMGLRWWERFLTTQDILDETPPYLQPIQIQMAVEQEEDVSVTMVIPSLAAKLDGKFRLDGTVKLNNGREVL